MTVECEEGLETDQDSSKVPLKPGKGDLVASPSTNGPRVNSCLDEEGRPLDGGISDGKPVLETAEEKRLRKRSHYIVYMTCFIMSLGFSIVLTGLWPYMKQLDPNASKEFLGWVVAANPFGQMIASPICGWFGNKLGSNRLPFIGTILMFIVGNILYAFLPLTRPYSDYFMVLSRFIVGVSSANIAICRSYIVSASKLRERTTALSVMAAAQSLGFILGPSIQSGVALAFPSETNTTVSHDNLDHHEVPLLNLYNVVAWMCVVMAFFILLLYLPFIFKEFNISAKEGMAQTSTAGDFELPRPDYASVVVILGAFFCSQSCFMLVETILVPLTMDLYAWPPEHAVFVAGIGLGILAALAAVWFILTAYLSKRFQERILLILLGFVPMLVGMVIMFPVGPNYPKVKECLAEPEEVFNVTEPFAEPCLFNCSGTESLARHRRAVAVSVNPNCGLGCPPEQEWCFYTPIIELPQLWCAYFFVFFGYPFSQVLCPTLMSKVLGPSPQGLWMGALTSTGSFSRIVGPIVVSYTYFILGTRWMSGLFTVMLVGITLLLVLFYKRLVPMKIASTDRSKAETKM